MEKGFNAGWKQVTTWSPPGGSSLGWQNVSIRGTVLQGPVRIKVLLISGDPVGRNVLLRRHKVQVSATHQLAKPAFQSVFHMGIPNRRGIRLGPEIADVIRSSES